MRDQIKKFLLYGKQLDLNGYDLNELPLVIPKEEIKQLDISNNCFKILPSLNEIPNIEILKCNSNKTTKICNYPKLKELYCMRNEITELPHLPMVEKIHCQDNFIRHVPTMENLIELRITDNPVVKIDFQPKLEILYISMNAIQDLPLLPRLRRIIIVNFHRFMDFHFLEDTPYNLRGTVIKQKIKYLKIYIHIVKMQRRFRRNKARNKLKQMKLCNDVIEKIIEYISL
jgi:Leucine-rich repeat (LRR) protein